MIYESSLQLFINGCAFFTGVGRLQLIRPSDYHRQRTKPGEHIWYYNLIFSADYLSRNLLETLTQDADPLSVTANEEEWADLRKLMQRIFWKFEYPEDRLGELIIRGGLEALSVYLLRHR